MHILVNGARRELPGPTTLRELLQAYRDQNSLVVGELNGEVPADEGVELAEGDRVEVVTFVGGG